jgi:5-methylcytosine-specific restriction protein A
LQHRLGPSPYNRRRWKAASRAFRSQPDNVWCAECREHGRLRRSTQTDHIIPHRGDEALFWDETNWQALCDRCHSRKTRRTPP